MPRSTDYYYDKIVAKHRTELCASLTAIQQKLKASYIWDLTDENCRQIYNRLNQLKIESSPTLSSGSVAVDDCGDLLFGAISVIELAYNNSGNPDSANDNNVLTFFGSIPSILENIENILVELESISSCNNNNNNEFSYDVNFIDVSATLTEPKLLENKEELLYRRDLLLHIKDYLGKNIDSNYLDGGNFQQNYLTSNHRMVINNNLDLCFIAGVFLGYPVIYCNSTPDIGNCLSYKQLHNYSVTVSSTQPATGNNNNSSKHGTFPLYSFSIPQIFADRYQARINRWFNLLLCAAKTKQTQDKFRLTLRESIDTYPLILT